MIGPFTDPALTELIHRRVQHHPPTSDAVVEAHSECRNRFAQLGDWINGAVPYSADKRRALEALDLAMMLTNAAIARTQLRRVDTPTL